MPERIVQAALPAPAAPVASTPQNREPPVVDFTSQDAAVRLAMVVEPNVFTPNSVASVEEVIINGLLAPEPLTVRVLVGVPLPTPNSALVLSQKREAEVFIADVPLPNSTRPAVKVTAPVPPLATARVPETSAVKLAKPLNSEPEVDLTIPVPKEDKVVEPKVLIVKRLVPVEEATRKGLVPPLP